MRDSLILLSLLLLLAGCDRESSVQNLEHEVRSLQAQIKQLQASVDSSVQATCARDSRAWLANTYLAGSDIVFVNYSNHYSRARNTCFLLAEEHVSMRNSLSWTNDISLWNVYENKRYGHYDESNVATGPKTKKTVDACEVQGRVCRTADEFHLLVEQLLYR